MTILAMRRLNRLPVGIGHGLGYLGILALLATTPAAGESSLGHIRTVEGNANLLRGGSEPAVEASANYPVQVGDQVLVSPGGRLEVVLPDASLVRIGENTELRFARLAQSADTRDDRNALEILQGQLQLTLVSDPIDAEAFRLDTANSSLYLLSKGSYRVFTDGKTWTQIIVREGFVEVTTESGSTRVGTGQQGLVDGDRSPRVTVQAAPELNSLEQWASRLDVEGNTVEAQIPYRREALPQSLGYSAARLHRHGRWMRYRGSQVWRPHAPIGWRPYHSGWWVYTPVGLTWVSTEPWGWVPYHYGEWGYAGGIGWVWHPGHRYTPGAVYWYWGPTHVGWVPAGYYSPRFGPRFCAMPPYGHFGGFHGRDFHRGQGPHATPLPIQAQAGGDVNRWHDWTFASYERFGYRTSHRFLETGAELQNRGVFQTEMPRGVVTTDTRRLTPNLWHEPRRAMATLDRPASTRPRSSGLSRLGAAALSRMPTHPTTVEDRQITGTRQTHRPVRQWDPKLWQRDHRARTRPVTPYRRDTRSSSSLSWGSTSSSRGSRSSRRPQTPGLSGRSSAGGSRFSRPVTPGIGRSTIGGSRSSSPSPRSGIDRGRAPAPGRSSAGGSSRVSGSGRPGPATRGGASRSTSGDGGSG